VYILRNLFQLRQVGFTNIDALDPNEALLEIAKKRDVYNRYFMEYLTAEPCSIPEGSCYKVFFLFCDKFATSNTKPLNKNNTQKKRNNISKCIHIQIAAYSLLNYILSLCISLEDNQVLHKIVNVQGSYDAVVGAGIYAAANYVPYDAIIDMIRMTKQGMILMLTLYCRIITECFIS